MGEFIPESRPNGWAADAEPGVGADTATATALNRADELEDVSLEIPPEKPHTKN